jgi:hypothetical protein
MAYNVRDAVAFNIAAAANNTALALPIMEKGSFVNVPEFGQENFSYFAVCNYIPPCTKRLVQLGAKINCL